MKTLTVKQVKTALKSNKYILARFQSGEIVGLNCKILPIIERRNYVPMIETEHTQIVSFYPCNFQEYINKKLPFTEPQTPNQPHP